MKKSSKYMPKYKQPKRSLFTIILGLFVLVFVVSCLIYLVSATPYLLSIVPIIGIFLYLENKKTQKKFSLLAKEREELSICEFARSFDTKKIDTWVVRAVYEQIQDYVPEIPIKADDSLFDLLEIDEEDLELSLVEEISQRTGRSLENTESNKFYGKLNTVRDLVFFFNEQPKI